MDQIHVVNAEIKALIEPCACVCVLRVSVRAAVEAERWCLECPALFVHEKEKGNQSCIFSIDSSRRMMCSNSNAAASSAVETLSATFGKVWVGVSENILRPPRHPLKSGDL